MIKYTFRQGDYSVSNKQASIERVKEKESDYLLFVCKAKNNHCSIPINSHRTQLRSGNVIKIVFPNRKMVFLNIYQCFFKPVDEETEEQGHKVGFFLKYKDENPLQDTSLWEDGVFKYSIINHESPNPDPQIHSLTIEKQKKDLKLDDNFYFSKNLKFSENQKSHIFKLEYSYDHGWFIDSSSIHGGFRLELLIKSIHDLESGGIDSKKMKFYKETKIKIGDHSINIES